MLSCVTTINQMIHDKFVLFTDTKMSCTSESKEKEQNFVIDNELLDIKRAVISLQSNGYPKRMLGYTSHDGELIPVQKILEYSFSIIFLHHMVLTNPVDDFYIDSTSDRMKREEESVYRWFEKEGCKDYKSITPMPLYLEYTIMILNGKQCELCEFLEKRKLEESEENAMDLEELDDLIQNKLNKLQ